MNMLGLDMNDNIKGRTASVRIVANFGSQILHFPRFLTPLAISRKFHASPLRGFLCSMPLYFTFYTVMVFIYLGYMFGKLFYLSTLF